MTNEEKAMLQLVASNASETESCALETCDYAKLVQTLNVQVIAPFISTKIDIINDTDALNEIKHERYSCISTAVNFLKEHDRLTAVFESCGIRLIILKGLAAAKNYPNPLLRVCGDIDCIVPIKDFDKALKILLEDGYIQEHRYDDNECHVTLNKNRYSIELHKKWVSESMSTVHEDLNKFVFDGFCYTEKVTINNKSFYAFSKLQNGMIILQHANRHMMQGIGLRQVLDWMMFVDKEMDDNYWYNSFKPYTDKFGLTTFAITLTRMCQLYLGLSETKNTWCSEADITLCDELLDFVLHNGNLGHNVSSRKSGQIAFILRPRSFKKRFSNLQKRGLRNWKTAQKFAVLRPFAWFYQLIRFLNKGLQDSGGLEDLFSDLQYASKENKIVKLMKGY